MTGLTYDITGTDTTATHGIYYVLNKTIWFRRAICTSSIFKSFADPIAIALWPMNSACIIGETKTVYGNISHKDDNVAQQTILY